MRLAVKKALQSLFVALVFPFALACAFGRMFRLYAFFSQMLAIVPGVIGDFTRAAFYRLTLTDCSIDVVIGFGTFFSRRDVVVGPNVSIGSFCVIGKARIGERTQIASHVEIPSGRYQHARQEDGRLAEESVDTEVVIGAHCWIGASAVVLANVGSGSTIGAGSVVVKELPPGVVAVGNPARVIRQSAAARRS